MTLQRRLITAFAVVVALFALDLHIYQWGTARRTAALERVSLADQRQLATLRLRQELADLRRMIDLTTQSGDGSMPLPRSTLDSFDEHSRAVRRSGESLRSLSGADAGGSVLTLLVSSDQLLATWRRILESFGVDQVEAVTRQVQADALVHAVVERQLPEIEEQEAREADLARGESHAVAQITKRLTAVIFSLSGVLAVLLAYSVLRRLSTGLRALHAGAERFGAGDLEHRIVLPGRDELAALAQRYNDMAENLSRARTETRRLEDELRALSRKDSLTDVPNRRAFDERLALEWQRGIRNHQPVSVLLIDVDRFKEYNDGLGHLAGDACLKRLAQTLAAGVRHEVDNLARYGGEEFGVLLTDANTEPVHVVAERLRCAVADLRLPHPASTVADWVTVSIGYCTLTPEQGDGADALVHQADAALYEAKKRGRNRVVGHEQLHLAASGM